MSVVGLYVALAKSTFESDKIAYVFDSRQTNLGALSSATTEKFERALLAAKLLLLGVNPKTKSLNQATQNFFNSQSLLTAVELVDGKGQPIVTLTKREQDRDIFSGIKMPTSEGTRITSLGEHLFLITAKEHGEDSAPWFIKAIAKFPDLLPPSFDEGNILLISGEQILSSQKDVKNLTPVVVEFSKDRSDVTAVRSIDGENYLISAASIKNSDLKLLAIDSEKVALGAIGVLYRRSIVFVIFSIFLTVIIALALSTRLTRKLQELTIVAGEIGQGNFSHQLSVTSDDEVGVLGQAFRRMSDEIQKLLVLTKEKARMDAELKTARLVQNNLFPKPSWTEKNELSVAGVYRTSTECGGDWWYYFERGDELFIIIADATGHGTPAALMTSAARSLFSKIERDDSSLIGIATDWDRAVAASSGQRVFMTALLFRINSKTGSGFYLNAAHEAPIIVKNNDGQLTSEPLELASGTFLGDSKQSWTEVPFKLDPGDRMLLFTDGVWDIANNEGKKFSSVRLMKALCRLASETEDAKAFVEKIDTLIHDHSQGRDYPDDVTLVAVCRKPSKVHVV